MSAVDTSDSLNTAFRQYYDLTKPRVVMLIVFTAIVGMLLAVQGVPDLLTVIAASLGIGLAASSGAAMNQIIDMRADAIMARTQNRPLATGGMAVWQAICFAALLCLLGMFVLIVWVNALTAVLTFVSMVGYGIIYTVFLKPATPQNIVIGGAAGAAPPLLGWVAMANAVTPEACLLFLIIFAWTPPHFWALALYRRRSDATGYTWRRIYPPANFTLFLHFSSRDFVAIYYSYVWRYLFARCDLSERTFYVLRY